MTSGFPRTVLCELLDIRVPIIQTAMGWVATPELVAASCNAGAFGFLAAATIPPQDIDAHIDAVQKLTDHAFGVNFLMEAPGADRIADAIVRRGLRAASYSRSPNPVFIERFKQAGVLCIPTCGAARHARKAQARGADLVLVQGGEGGGHTGTVPTSILVPQVVDAVDVPVVAAGGFRDGRGLVSALAFGAVGIAMGTRFLLTAESPMPARTAQRYFEAEMTDITVTTEVDGMPQRVVVNELVRRLEAGGAPARLLRALRSAIAYRKLSGASLTALLRSAMSLRREGKLSRSQTLMAANAPVLVRRAMLEGDPEAGVLPSGSIAGVIDDRPRCADLIDGIMDEARRVLEGFREWK